MKTNSLLFCLILLAQTSFAQYNPTIPAKKLKKEFSAMVKKMEAHPSLYRHITEEQLAHTIDR